MGRHIDACLEIALKAKISEFVYDLIGTPL